MLNNSTHFFISAMMWFEKVQRCSMRLNYTELVQNHPAHLASPLNMLVQADCNSSNLLEPQHHRDSKVWRGLSHEFGVVRLYRTFSIYITAGETRCAGCLCTSSGWFKHIEPHRTYSNHNITEIARCGEVCHMSSGLFDCTEPSLSTSLQGFV